MMPSEMEQLRVKLENLRQESLRFLERLKNESRSLDSDSTQDSADRCVANLSKESLFEQSSQRRTILRLIEAALGRMTKGSFGVCVACGMVPRRLAHVFKYILVFECVSELESVLVFGIPHPWSGP